MPRLMGIYDQYNVEVADSFDSPVSETLMSLVPYVAYFYPRECLLTGTISYGINFANTRFQGLGSRWYDC